MTHRLFIWMVLLSLTVPIVSPAQNFVPLRLVVISDSSAPGAPGATFGPFHNPLIDQKGRVLVLGSLLGAGIDASNDDGIWMERNDTTLALVAREGTQATD